jgi:serine protease Do
MLGFEATPEVGAEQQGRAERRGAPTGPALSRVRAGRRLSLLTASAAVAVFLGAAFAVRPPDVVHAGMPLSAIAAPVAASTGYADVVARVAPSIVTVYSERMVKPAALRFGRGELPPMFRGFGIPENPEPRRQGGLGSGVIVSSDGTILTNNHVVDGAERVKVELSDKRTYTAKVVGTDAPSDLAVLKLEEKGLPALPFGNSDALRVGDVVLAFGNPLGIGQTVTMGIVSAKGRATGTGDGSFEDFLQTDASINQGNSGGALVNTKGELVGINSQIVSPSGGNIGIGFSIPSHMAETVMTQLANGGTVHRGQLGVTIQNITADMAQSLGLDKVQGALVGTVTKGSPADKAGVERGDVIVSVEGERFQDSNALRNHIAATAPGTSVTLGLIRDGKSTTAHVQLAELRSAKAEADATETADEGGGKLGLSLQPLTPRTAKELGLDVDQGLLVAEVDPTSPAADAGFQPGDVIQEVNRRPVTNVVTLRAAVKASGTRPALVLISRKGASLFLTIEPPRA